MRVTTLAPVEAHDGMNAVLGDLVIDLRASAAYGNVIRITFFSFSYSSASYAQSVVAGDYGAGPGGDQYIDGGPFLTNTAEFGDEFIPASGNTTDGGGRPTPSFIILVTQNDGGGATLLEYDFLLEYTEDGGASWAPVPAGAVASFRSSPRGVGNIIEADPVGAGYLSVEFGGSDIPECFWTDLTFVTQSSCVPPGAPPIEDVLTAWVRVNDDGTFDTSYPLVPDPPGFRTIYPNGCAIVSKMYPFAIGGVMYPAGVHRINLATAEVLDSWPTTGALMYVPPADDGRPIMIHAGVVLRRLDPGGGDEAVPIPYYDTVRGHTQYPIHVDSLGRIYMNSRGDNAIGRNDSHTMYINRYLPDGTVDSAFSQVTIYSGSGSASIIGGAGVYETDDWLYILYVRSNSTGSLRFARAGRDGGAPTLVTPTVSGAYGGSAGPPTLENGRLVFDNAQFAGVPYDMLALTPELTVYAPWSVEIGIMPETMGGLWRRGDTFAALLKYEDMPEEWGFFALGASVPPLDTVAPLQYYFRPGWDYGGTLLPSGFLKYGYGYGGPPIEEP